MTLARSLVALVLIGVVLTVFASINPNPPPQVNKAGRYMAVIVNLNSELDLACVMWSEQRIQCQAIRKSRYRPCRIVDGAFNCNPSFNF